MPIVLIQCKDCGNEKCPSVVPGTVWARSGRSPDRISWFTRHPVRIWLPDPSIFQEKVPTIVDLDASSSPLTLTIKPGIQGDTTYPYCVFCKEEGTFAQGNSEPKILVRDP